MRIVVAVPISNNNDSTDTADRSNRNAIVTTKVVSVVSKETLAVDL